MVNREIVAIASVLAGGGGMPESIPGGVTEVFDLGGLYSVSMKRFY